MNVQFYTGNKNTFIDEVEPLIFQELGGNKGRRVLVDFVDYVEGYVTKNTSKAHDKVLGIIKKIDEDLWKLGRGLQKDFGDACLQEFNNDLGHNHFFSKYSWRNLSDVQKINNILVKKGLELICEKPSKQFHTGHAGGLYIHTCKEYNTSLVIKKVDEIFGSVLEKNDLFIYDRQQKKHDVDLSLDYSVEDGIVSISDVDLNITFLLFQDLRKDCNLPSKKFMLDTDCINSELILLSFPPLIPRNRFFLDGFINHAITR